MKGLLFTPEMARAVLRKNMPPKTQTRRVVPGVIKPCRVFDDTYYYMETEKKATPPRDIPADFCHYRPGEIVCLLTTWAVEEKYDHVRPSEIPMAAFPSFWHAGMSKRKPLANVPPLGKSRPGRFLPNAMRHLMPALTIGDVDVQRVREITEVDAIAEGVEPIGLYDWRHYGDDAVACSSARRSFRSLWNSINAKRGKSWARNPQVFVVKFSREALPF